MAGDLLAVLVKTNLAAAAAILLVLALRKSVRKAFGARLAYTLWLLVPLAVGGSLLPARAIVISYEAAAGPAATEPLSTIASAPIPPVASGAPVIDSETLILCLWLAGAGISLALLAWNQSRFTKSLGGVVREGRFLRAGKPGAGPAVVGAFFARIVLPADFEARYDPAERQVVLAHEAAHLASGDALVNAAVALAQCLFWFNPPVHLAARKVRIDQELACDAAVLSAYPHMRRPYAEALLKTQIAATPLPLGCYWPAGASSPLKERIAMLKLQIPSRSRRLVGGAGVFALCMGAGFAAWAAQPATVTLAPQLSAAASVMPDTPATTGNVALAATEAVAAARAPVPASGSGSGMASPAPVETTRSSAGNTFVRIDAGPSVGGLPALRVIQVNGAPKTLIVPREMFASPNEETEAYRAAKHIVDAAVDEQSARAARGAPPQPLTPELASALNTMRDFTREISAKRTAEIDARYDRVIVALDGSTPPERPSPRDNSIMLLVPKNMTRVSKAAALTSVEIQLALAQPEAAPVLRQKARAILDARPTVD